MSAEFNFPIDLECTDNGDIYISDMHNHVVRKIDMSTGIVTTVAGSGSIGISPDGTPAREAKFYQPVGVAYNNKTKTLYIADQYNHQVRKVINP
jgi:DNA-binding beta-propeller fold protein YncE